jgi:two-component system response regulator DevR
MKLPRLTEKVTVFIADDSLVVQERLTTLLNELDGIEIVGHAQTVSEAVSAIRKVKPAVVILDIHMPGGSGIDVLRSIKQEESATVVIVVTNYAYPQYRAGCFEAGAEFFFDKSSEFEQIPAVLAQLKKVNHEHRIRKHGRPP